MDSTGFWPSWDWRRAPGIMLSRKKVTRPNMACLRKPLLEIAEHYPEYGYRRTTSELQDWGYPINHKVVQRLHRSWYLAFMKKLKTPKPNPIHKLLQEVRSSMNLVSRLKEIDDLEVLYTDFAEVIYQKGGAKAQLMPIVDRLSRALLGS